MAASAVIDSAPASSGSEFFGLLDFSNLNSSAYEEDYDYDGQGEDYYHYDSNLSFEDTLILPKSDRVSSNVSLTIRLLQSVKNHSLYNLTLLPKLKPKIWNSRDAFIDKVALKVYMVPPAIVGGIVAGILMWCFYLLILKLFSALRKQGVLLPGRTKSLDIPKDFHSDRSQQRRPSKTSNPFDSNKSAEFAVSVGEPDTLSLQEAADEGSPSSPSGSTFTCSVQLSGSRDSSTTSFSSPAITTSSSSSASSAESLHENGVPAENISGSSSKQRKLAIPSSQIAAVSHSGAQGVEVGKGGDEEVDAIHEYDSYRNL